MKSKKNHWFPTAESVNHVTIKWTEKKKILNTVLKKNDTLHFLLFLSAKNHHWYPFMECFIQEYASEKVSTWNTCIFLLKIVNIILNVRF